MVLLSSLDRSVVDSEGLLGKLVVAMASGGVEDVEKETGIRIECWPVNGVGEGVVEGIDSLSILDNDPIHQKVSSH